MKYTFLKRFSLCIAVLAFTQMAQAMKAPRQAKIFNRHIPDPVVQNLGEDAKFKMTIASVNKGNIDNVNKALGYSPQFATAEDSYGNSLLTFAAKQGDTKIAQLLIDKGARVNWPNTMMKTALEFAILAGHDDMIRLLKNNGAIVYAKFISVLKPTQSYSSWMANTFKSDYVENLGLNLTLTEADKLHITLAYVSVPMEYADNEELYISEANTMLQNVESDMTATVNHLGDALRTDNIAWDKIEPIGRFVGVSYKTPASVKALIDSLYSTLKKRIPSAQETYPARLNLHISVAEMKEGKLDPQKVILPQPIRSGWNRLALEGPHGLHQEVTVNLPTKAGLYSNTFSWTSA